MAIAATASTIRNWF